MTMNDPIQGILVRSPETLFFVNKAAPITKPHTPKTDRLQGIVFKHKPTSASLGSAKLTGPKMLPFITEERIRDIDNLTVAQLEEVTAGMVLAAQKQKASIVHTTRHNIIHSIHLPLRREKW